MQIIRTLNDLTFYLKSLDKRSQVLVDTGFLYAMSYYDDRQFTEANDLFDLLASHNTIFYANVISRMEFIDLLFRK